jgi:hypothetical protein
VSTFDVVIWDDHSAAFSPRLAEEKGLGGVEWTLMLLAEALADDGLRVLVLNKFDGSWRRPVVTHGVLEYGHVARAFEEKLACDALVVSRWSVVPPIETKRVVFSLHDIPDRWMFRDNRRWLDDGSSAVCVSTWLAGKVRTLDEDSDSEGRSAEWATKIIAPMLLDECYVRGPKDERQFAYLSAAVKGLPATIDAWAIVREHFSETHWGELLVATNGYDEPTLRDLKRMNELGIRSLGQLPGRRIISTLRNAAGLFFVNDYPETHCLIASTALALGCRCHVLTLGDPAALPETLAGAPLLTRSRHEFIEQFVDAYLHPGPQWLLPESEVPDHRAAALLPAWKEVLFDAP